MPTSIYIVHLVCDWEKLATEELPSSPTPILRGEGERDTEGKKDNERATSEIGV